ncbi:MAG: mechanosensitive ion channel family protein [Gemmatimonadota bacterium]|nr:mechanosensitive ion channel family protein [Gemmatimonadota bacterium]
MYLVQVAPATEGLTIIPGVSPEIQANLIVSLLIIVAVLFVRRGTLAIVQNRVEDTEVRYRWAKVTSNIAFVVAVLLLGQVWFTALRSLGTFLGLVSAGLAIALRDLVAGLAGWLFISWRRPFDVGDRIQIGSHAGDVVDRRLFQFTIMEIGNWVSADQSTGRLIHIPNQSVFTEPLANYVAGFPYLWNELKVLVTFESNWRKAKQLINDLAQDLTIEITREATRPVAKGEPRFLIRYRKLTPVVYVSVEDSGVLLTLRYLSRPRERRGSSSQMWERVLDTIAEHPDIHLAYPTQRINLSREVLADGEVVPGGRDESVAEDGGAGDDPVSAGGPTDGGDAGR